MCSSSSPASWARGWSREQHRPGWHRFRPAARDCAVPRRGLHHLLGHGRAGHRAAAARRWAGRGGHRCGPGRSQRRAGVGLPGRHDSRARRGSDRGGRAMTGTPRHASGTGSRAHESLYPFLYSGTTDLAAVLEEARRSTVAKAAEIMELRRVISARDGARLKAAARDAAERFAAGGRLLAFGNGGSATDAQQLATTFLNPGGAARPLPALGLASDTSVVTALANDVGVEVMFARQIAAFGRRTDIALGLSTSGNSENLLRAFGEASRRG